MNHCQRIHLDEIEFDVSRSENSLVVTMVELAAWLVLPTVLILATVVWLVSGRKTGIR